MGIYFYEKEFVGVLCGDDEFYCVGVDVVYVVGGVVGCDFDVFVGLWVK